MATTTPTWIAQAAQRLGVPEATLQQAVGAILVFLQNRQEQQTDNDYHSNSDATNSSTKDVFSTIIAALGAQAWMRQAQQQQQQQQSSSSRTTASSPTSLVGLVLFLLQLVGIWNILRQVLQHYRSTVGLRILQALEDGTQLDQLLSRYGISHEQGMILFQYILLDYLPQKVSPETIQQFVNLVPALQGFLDESRNRAKKD